MVNIVLKVFPDRSEDMVNIIKNYVRQSCNRFKAMTEMI